MKSNSRHPRQPRATLSEVRRDEPSSRDAQGRSIIQCNSCGRTDIPEAAHGLCFTCYRREKRAQRPVRHMIAPMQRREQIRLTKLYSAMMTTAIGLGMSDEDQRELQRLIAPYLDLVPNLLGTPDIEDEGSAPVNTPSPPVNVVHKQIRVHSSQAGESAAERR